MMRQAGILERSNDFFPAECGATVAALDAVGEGELRPGESYTNNSSWGESEVKKWEWVEIWLS